MSLINTIKNLFGGNLEGKIGDLLTGLIDKIKPLIAEGKIGDLLKGAVENFGDLGQKLKDILAKITGASKEEKADLIAEKNNIIADVKTRGMAVVEAAGEEENLPDTVKQMAGKVSKLLGKL
ncbi:MAG: hypothetical protein E7331_06695 [Clostridiales bacterium]|nr:hypothetical protein [Clostridiales bacterium]